ncbi:MAG TPA: aminotransferase class III-fold pyridoxal phosphate-dependent enzyme, partial [Clostridiales bacterium]|nr:aminotransferase class III-fold pyridoxal phosphate-dependent enzyme [Clostridiales bacterium]
NEGMVKLARKYSHDKYGDGRSTILTLLNSFHGRTITTLKATGQDHFHEYFMPFTPGFSYAPANNYDALIAAVKEDTCAIMFELIQGEGGVMPMDREYVQKVAAFCKAHDLLFLIDEVQTGIGRTGKLFAYMNYGIQPDVVSFAKGIAGGLPMGGFICSKELENVLGPGDHGSTFGGNPVACASANVVLDILTDDLIDDVAKRGEYIMKTIASWHSDFITSVRGMGFMIGIGLEGVQNKDLAKALMERGLLVLTAGQNTLRLLPPLVISKEELEEGLEIMAGLLKA